MSKRANGTGSKVRRKADGRFYSRITDPSAPSGYRYVYGRTEAEAERKRHEALERLEQGAPVVESGETMNVVARRYLSQARVRQGLAPSSVRTYSYALKQHILPVIGHKRMRDLTGADVADALAAMQAKGLSASYVRVAHKAMSGVFRTAVQDGLMRRNPAAAVTPPRPGRSEKVVPTAEQVAALVAAAPDERMRTLVMLLAHTGGRIGEVLSLRWSDWRGDELRFMTTKGDRPRSVPVTPALAEQLHRWRAALAAERLASVWWDDDADWLLPTTAGTRWDPSNARKRWVPMVAGVCPGATPHSLRHAAATILLEQGVPMKVVSELLGHRDLRTTAEVYSHVTARMLTTATDALGQAYGG